MIYLSVCSRNTVFWNVVTGISNASAHVAQNKNLVCKLAPYVGDSLISRARNISLANFLADTDCNYLLTIDDDVELPVDGITKLVEADKDIIGGLYRMKDINPTANPYVIRWSPEQENKIPNDTPVEITYVASGCALYKRSFI